MTLATRYQEPVVTQLSIVTFRPPTPRIRMSPIGVPTWRTSMGAGVPTAPPQDYYWSAEWQRAEKEALAEIRRGEGVSFDCLEDAIRWLQEE